jgi:hypothetical protein
MLRQLLTTVSCIALAFAVPYVAIAADADNSSAPASITTQKAASSKADTKVEQQKQDQTAEKRKAITAEAMAAVGETRNALKALDESKKDDALAALERATGKLELILARDPSLALAPTNVNAVTIDVVADIDRIKKVRKEAEKMMDKGEVQAARHLLGGLASETVINVTNIPLATYPAAIKQAAKLVDDGKQDDAKKILQTALNTMVVTQTIIPLPVSVAQEQLIEAKKLSEKASRTQDENKRLDTLLADAHTKLEFAQALGYGTKQDFKDLYAQLDEIKDKTSQGKSGTGFFAKIESSLSSLVKSSQPQAANPPAGGTNKPTSTNNAK